MLEDEAWLLLAWHADFKNLGVLPFGGRDLMQEPAWLVEAFRAIEGIKNKVQEEQAKKWQEKAKSGSSLR